MTVTLWQSGNPRTNSVTNLSCKRESFPRLLRFSLRHWKRSISWKFHVGEHLILLNQNKQIIVSLRAFDQSSNTWTYPTLGSPTIPHFREVPNLPIKGVGFSSSFFLGGIFKMAEMEKYLEKNEFSKLTTVNANLPRWLTTITEHTPCMKPLIFCFDRLLLCMYSLASNQMIIFGGNCRLSRKFRANSRRIMRLKS